MWLRSAPHAILYDPLRDSGDSSRATNPKSSDSFPFPVCRPSDRYLLGNSIEIVAAREWYLPDDTFDLKRMIASWNEKLARASAKGYAGVRVTGDTAWLERK